MAKGKHATALFEVIHGDKRYSHNKTESVGSLRTPKWWFKGRSRKSAATDAASASVHPSTPALAPGGQVATLMIPGDSAHASLGYAASDAPSHGHGVHMSLDPERQEVTFRLRYTTAIVSGFAILVAITLAYFFGQKSSTAPTGILGPSLAEVRKQPPRSDVLNVSLSSNVQTTADINEPPPSATLLSTKPTTWNDNRAGATLVVRDGKRQINLNYAVIQSYTDEKTAKEAVDFLTKNGVPCTIEREVKGWRSDLYLVVGLDGHQSAFSREYAAYVRKIQGLSGKQNYRTYDPSPKKWDKQG